MPDEMQNTGSSFGTVSHIIELLEPLSTSDREHALRTVTTWFRLGFVPTGGTTEPAIAPQMSMVAPQSSSPKPSSPNEEKFAGRPVLSAKDFIFEKDPQTESERLACLAFYLTHFLETPHFKNSDLSHLNIEAAQRKLSNPGVAANNAIRDGFFVPATKIGYKQLSAMGERFVLALPNRAAALQVKSRMLFRRGKRSSVQTGSGELAPEIEESQD